MKDLMKTLFSVMIIVLLYYMGYGEGRRILSMKDFIASDHTNVDYSQAMQKAWKELCKDQASSNGSALVIEKKETYTLQPQLFEGPCVSSDVHIQIDGKIKAPAKPRDWENSERQCWLCFKDIVGLVLNGSGVLLPHGEAWWPSVRHSKRPTTISFDTCHGIVYNGLTQMNSPKNHISVVGCKNVTLSNLNISAPHDSPNTDGINICESHNIHVLDSSIQTGDDCVAITGGKGGSSDINITRVACGPGHGISIGSLGKDETDDIVENVNVKSCSFSGTQNGARIKTWHGGQGSARNILYEHITLVNASFPIIIDQNYTDSRLKGNAVRVDNVKFRHFKGTSASKIAIKLNCENCHNIVMEHINITSSSPDTKLKAYCRFADVRTSFVNIDVKCNACKYHQPPALSPEQPPALSPDQPPALSPDQPPALSRLP
ncbi:hypothetical protein CARUB_v10007828mg [Capsella rubella]|uniref:Polygalacturonase n=1 Tax=Capsella rubella TaxID=81985 RepID=R0H6H4_9BRAS|nr:probable polygalacturonase At3g15720 [Capsella rubella]EOA19153.1 hypothetical protein CARUB_v10007828mg [Capsella rubella]